MPVKISIIGDLFMRADMFGEAIRDRCKLFEVEIAKHDFAWPDAPMEHGYAVQGMDGLKGHDLGGVTLNLGVDNHQAMNQVFLTQIREGQIAKVR